MSLSAKIVWLDIFSALCDSLLIKWHVCVAKETFDRIQWLSSNSHKNLKGGKNILGRNFSGRNKSLAYFRFLPI